MVCVFLAYTFPFKNHHKGKSSDIKSAKCGDHSKLTFLEWVDSGTLGAKFPWLHVPYGLDRHPAWTRNLPCCFWPLWTEKISCHFTMTSRSFADGLPFAVFTKKQPNDTIGTNSTPNSHFWIMERSFMNHFRVWNASKTRILVIYVATQMEMCFMTHDDFLPKCSLSNSTIFARPIGVYLSMEKMYWIEVSELTNSMAGRHQLSKW